MLAHDYTRAIEYAQLARQATGELETRARLALRTAGDRALALYAFPAAVRFYGGALELWPQDDAERPQLLFRYGKAVFWAESGGEDGLATARGSSPATATGSRTSGGRWRSHRRRTRPRRSAAMPISPTCASTWASCRAPGSATGRRATPRSVLATYAVSAG